MADAPRRPSVLFVCVHNAGRSQMAAGWLRHFARDQVVVRSAGSEPADQINPTAVQAMAEVDIDIAGAVPVKLDDDLTQGNDVVVTMGCGDACPFFPGHDTRTGRSLIRPVNPSKWSARYVMRSAIASERWLPSCNRWVTTDGRAPTSADEQ